MKKNFLKKYVKILYMKNVHITKVMMNKENVMMKNEITFKVAH